MGKRVFVAVMIVAGVGLIGCRDDADTGKDIPLTEDHAMVPRADTNADVEFYDQSNVPQSSSYIPDESGDVSAKSYQGLQGYLPSSVSGYDMAAPAGGSQQEVQGITLNSAEQQWKSSDGGRRMKIVVTDCGTNDGGYALATTFLFPPELGSKEARAINDPNGGLSGVVVYRKEFDETQGTIGVSGRYIVDVKVSGGGDRSAEAEEVAMEVVRMLKSGG